MGGDERVVRLSIPAKPEYIVLSRLALAGLARFRTLPADTLADLKLAVTEACSNSVRHAYDGNHGGQVEIVYRLETDRLVVDVLDDGPGFPEQQPRRFPEQQLRRDEPDESGLGLAIIRSLTDELELGGRDGRPGARLRFMKKLAE